MKLISAITSHNESVQSNLKSISVPEWKDDDGNPMFIYYKPSINLKAHERIEGLKNEGKTAEALATALIIRALDEEGEKLLKNSDKSTLTMSANTEVLLRVISEMSKGDEELEADEVKKNLE